MNKYITAGDVLDRLKEINGFKKDSELAILLGVTSSSLGNWRNRDALNYHIVISKCVELGLDLNWLLLGKSSNSEQENEIPNINAKIKRILADKDQVIQNQKDQIINLQQQLIDCMRNK